jgi:hypothetical protein
VSGLSCGESHEGYFFSRKRRGRLRVQVRGLGPLPRSDSKRLDVPMLSCVGSADDEKAMVKRKRSVDLAPNVASFYAVR